MGRLNMQHASARILFVAELAIFVWVYFYGAYGFFDLLAMREDSLRLVEAKENKNAKIQTLQADILAWNMHSFEKERLAREVLQMGKKGEVVYFVK